MLHYAANTASESNREKHISRSEAMNYECACGNTEDMTLQLKFATSKFWSEFSSGLLELVQWNLTFNPLQQEVSRMFCRSQYISHYPVCISMTQCLHIYHKTEHTLNNYTVISKKTEELSTLIRYLTQHGKEHISKNVYI
jgi:hypothetical protein